MKEELIQDLNKILPVVVRVHGAHHPELHQVADLYTALKENPTVEIAARLREVTDDFTPPADACPTYCKTYNHLSALIEVLV